MRSLGVVSHKGGVGKTTTAVNLAAAFAARGLRTVVLDCDPQGGASLSLGMDRGELVALSDRFLGALHTPRLAAELPVDVPGDFSLVPGGLALLEAETAREPLAFGQVLDALADRFDVALLDCPPSLGRITQGALESVDGFLVPCTPEFLALGGTANLLEAVEALGVPSELLGIVLTRVDRRLRETHELVGDLRGHFGRSVLGVEIPTNVAVARAPRFGVPVLIHDRWSRGALAYGRLALEVLKRLRASEGKASRRKEGMTV